MSDHKTKPATDPARVCERCGTDLEAALRLPARIGQPAYDIFRCVACGLVDWVAQGPGTQS